MWSACFFWRGGGGGGSNFIWWSKSFTARANSPTICLDTRCTDVRRQTGYRDTYR